MKAHLSVMLLLASITPAYSACDVDAISRALDAPLAALKPLEIPVTEVASTEGGIWSIYREADGRLNTVARADYGESGRRELRLSVVNRSTYGIADTRVDYLRHAFLEDAGPNGTARRTTTYYYYCDGKALVPPAEASMVDGATYPKEAAAALKLMRDDPDIASFTIGLKK